MVRLDFLVCMLEANSGAGAFWREAQTAEKIALYFNYDHENDANEQIYSPVSLFMVIVVWSMFQSPSVQFGSIITEQGRLDMLYLGQFVS